MIFNLQVKIKVTAEHVLGMTKSKHRATKFYLETSRELDERKYVDRVGIPTKDGSKAITEVMVQGLIGNIHQAHQNGFIDSAEHLRLIISRLEEGLVAVVDINIENFD